MQRSAIISTDGQYRYALRRAWDRNRPSVLFIGLNPSRADDRVDDRTINRCIRFADAWGYGQLVMGNLFAFRTPYPRSLWRARDPIGPLNDRWLRRLIAEADITVVAWGTKGNRWGRDRVVLNWIASPKCLAISKHGHPKHPLYLPASSTLRELGEWTAPPTR